LGVKFCHLNLVTLGKLEKLLALKSLEIVDPSVYHFLRPSQHLDADIIPSDSEGKRFLLLSAVIQARVSLTAHNEGKRVRLLHMI